MVKSLPIALILLSLASGVGVHSQAPAATPDEWLFVATPRASLGGILRESLSPGAAKIAKVQKALLQAGGQGYGIQLMARSSSSLSALLKRDGTGPRTYRTVATSGKAELLTALNEAAAQGFRLLPSGAKVFNQSHERYKEQWIAILAQQADDARFRYSVVEGANEAAERELGEATARGAALVSVLGTEPFGFNPKPVMILEAGPATPSAPPERSYRILSTVKTSTLEQEINRAAAEGFRASASGVLTVIMDRQPGAAAGPVEYRVVATTRVSTASRELSTAGAEGFRLAVVPEASSEGVFVLERAPGHSGTWEYSTATLKPNTAGRELQRAHAEGYRPVVLFEDVVVFERSTGRVPTLSRVSQM